MLQPLIIGCITILFSMAVQIAAIVYMLRYLMNLIARRDETRASFLFDSYVLSMVLSMLFVGHLAQVGLWALLFLYLGEFSDFMTAFYHSTVNFSSLGYGDIVMSEQWRLLGALEASSGVLMLGLSSGTLFAVTADLFSRHSTTKS